MQKDTFPFESSEIFGYIISVDFILEYLLRFVLQFVFFLAEI